MGGQQVTDRQVTCHEHALCMRLERRSCKQGNFLSPLLSGRGLSTAMSTKSSRWRRGEKRRRDDAPLDMKGCAICCYIWGEKLPIMVDVMVLGYSLQEHGNKAERMLCINDDTLQNKVANLMKAFWTFVPVHHVELPAHLRGSEQKRLQGVYSKLQTVKLFS